ncbi:hypothetical protein BU24DRAFT_422321 [Aaosphaeria arxii CBS 175.79]|uniref:Uncharacterized protein n=1 Tax=Aaosphaeria arxii CBS 175.79 TaxID=1450172 RepID=A0A6A5XRR7_9PLEO|nr:uncharacterized protein BU24DRAFT_422321 [Aaosphaeria arxii CBS 175.79]KAF2016005.1 hypothetical protein BU24DRAFT_422321 [Aaosphaeria arxii CBS 175.79]
MFTPYKRGNSPNAPVSNLLSFNLPYPPPRRLNHGIESGGEGGVRFLAHPLFLSNVRTCVPPDVDTKHACKIESYILRYSNICYYFMRHSFSTLTTNTNDNIASSLFLFSGHSTRMCVFVFHPPEPPTERNGQVQQHHERVCTFSLPE